jgi:hypothetical protein
MQHTGIGSGGNPPSLFAQTEAKFGILPVEKETLVQHTGIFYSPAGNQHAGAIEGVKPIVFVRLCA